MLLLFREHIGYTNAPQWYVYYTHIASLILNLRTKVVGRNETRVLCQILFSIRSPDGEYCSSLVTSSDFAPVNVALQRIDYDAKH